MKNSITILLSIFLFSYSFKKNNDTKVEWNKNLKYKVSSKSTGDSFVVIPFSYMTSYEIQDSDIVIFDSHCMVNKKKFANIQNIQQGISFQNFNFKIIKDYNIIDSSKIEELFLKRGEQLYVDINNEKYCTKNIVSLNMDSLNNILDYEKQNWKI